jgi:hypothetical protein
MEKIVLKIAVCVMRMLGKRRGLYINFWFQKVRMIDSLPLDLIGWTVGVCLLW